MALIWAQRCRDEERLAMSRSHGSAFWRWKQRSLPSFQASGADNLGSVPVNTAPQTTLSARPSTKPSFSHLTDALLRAAFNHSVPPGQRPVMKDHRLLNARGTVLWLEVIRDMQAPMQRLWYSSLCASFHCPTNLYLPLDPQFDASEQAHVFSFHLQRPTLYVRP
jgi:hypothetical protein